MSKCPLCNGTGNLSVINKDALIVHMRAHEFSYGKIAKRLKMSRSGVYSRAVRLHITGSALTL
jgi:hypothetical protein